MKVKRRFRLRNGFSMIAYDTADTATVIAKATNIRNTACSTPGSMMNTLSITRMHPT